MYLSGNYYSVEEKSDVDYDLYNEKLSEELNESAMEEALSDMEEEYDSETVSDYMNYGV